MRPLLGWYGDDFTGATDTLASLAQANLRALLFLGVPTEAHLRAAGPLDAIGIAGAARAMAPVAMQAELEPVGRFFAGLEVPVLHYKICSTFDSAPAIGNIAVAINTLRPHVANAFVPIVGGQPNIGRYCAFSNLFAAAGFGGTVHRIDRHPTMSRHPVTPMHEADLRVHLAAQGLDAIGAMHYPAYETGDERQDALLETLLSRAASAARQGAGIDIAATPHYAVEQDLDLRAVLFDVVTPAHLAAVGRLIWQRAGRQRLLAVGSSSVVQALAAHWDYARALAAAHHDAAEKAPSLRERACTAGPLATGAGQLAMTSSAPGLSPAAGPVFVLSGSMSPVTAQQIESATAYERLPADASRLAGDAAYVDDLVERITTALAARRNVLVHTTTQDGKAPDTTVAAQVARATAAVVTRVVSAMAALCPLRRVGIAGGDTSSHVAQAMGLWGLSFQTTMAPGVTLSRAHADDPALDGLELMLKGGQMGDAQLLDRLVAGG